MDMHFHSTAFGKHVMIDPKSLRLSALRSTDEHDSCSSWCFVEQRNKSRLLGGRDNKGDNKERMEGKVTSGGSKGYEKDWWVFASAQEKQRQSQEPQDLEEWICIFIRQHLESML
ncbi:hypothetical protein T4A_10242 [Trichinella pseudospiralis]|uniref:Uncharacterized protein n=2 Tax=Trichinella pseudospiralis TaxID=6337 RepID=A0A0V1EE37_TRIPS|nr:hypothetical protein T4A_10242 [Trichinella pseudospiralis]